MNHLETLSLPTALYSVAIGLSFLGFHNIKEERHRRNTAHDDYRREWDADPREKENAIDRLEMSDDG